MAWELVVPVLVGWGWVVSRLDEVVYMYLEPIKVVQLLFYKEKICNLPD